MNYQNLEALIRRYEENHKLINDEEHNELFKWMAVQHFHNVWFSADSAQSFSQMFERAIKESSVLIDNSKVSPTDGVVKMAELRPAEVEHLFRNVLFAPYSSTDELQNHVERFLEGMEKIRLELFPQFYRYKQDRHAASCYLALHSPEKHFIYKYSVAEEFARYIEFGKDLGAGESFRLANYYEMANLVVEELSKPQYGALIKKYEDNLSANPSYYRDKSLHIMAFDLMYCCRNYNFYSGLTHALKKDSIHAYKEQLAKQQEAAEKQKQIEELEAQIRELDISIEPYAEISLLGVKVHQTQYGDGIIVKQDVNKVTVRFSELDKVFTIDKKYPMRPRFENDEEAVKAFTQYAELVEAKDSLAKKLKEYGEK